MGVGVISGGLTGGLLGAVWALMIAVLPCVTRSKVGNITNRNASTKCESLDSFLFIHEKY